MASADGLDFDPEPASRFEQIGTYRDISLPTVWLKDNSNCGLIDATGLLTTDLSHTIPESLIASPTGKRCGAIIAVEMALNQEVVCIF
jgi:hypothetical protein